jgi:hypothetical protein
MIFPDMPRRTLRWAQTKAQPAQTMEFSAEATDQVETHSHIQEETAQAWFDRKFPEQKIKVIEPAVWPEFSEDPRGYIEFVILCVGLVCWAAYWYQFQ